MLSDTKVLTPNWGKIAQLSLRAQAPASREALVSSYEQMTLAYYGNHTVAATTLPVNRKRGEFYCALWVYSGPLRGR